MPKQSAGRRKSLRNSEERAVRQRKAIADLALDPVVHSDDRDAAFSRLVQTACDTIHVARANIWQFSSDKTMLECVAFSGVDPRGATPGMQLKTADFPEYLKTLQKRAGCLSRMRCMMIGCRNF